MNEAIPKKPEALGESPSTGEISYWMQKESEYQIHTFLKGKEDAGEEVEHSPEGVADVMRIQANIIGELVSRGLVK